MGRSNSIKGRSVASSAAASPTAKRHQQLTVQTANDKKTRWLLTRKTWRYMADAGRKLIPDSLHNKPEDIEKLEEHFQKVCQNERKFLIWKRKMSYPGASGSSLRKRKGGKFNKRGGLGSPLTGSSADECDDERPRGKSNDELIIKMLERYLRITDNSERYDELNERNDSPCGSGSISGGGSGRQFSFNDYPSASTSGKHTPEPMSPSSSSRGKSSSFSPTKEIQLPFDENLDVSKSHIQDYSIWDPVSGNDTIHTALLLDSLKQYCKRNYSPYVDTNEITLDLLKDKILLRKILSDMKMQQKLSKTIPRTDSTRSLSVSYSSSMSSLTLTFNTISSTFHNFVDFIEHKTGGCRSSPKSSSGLGSSGGSPVTSPDPTRQHVTFSNSRAVLDPSHSLALLSRPHQVYNKEKQIFANKQLEQLHQQQLQQQGQNYPLRTRTVSKTIKTITSTSTSSSSSLSKTCNTEIFFAAEEKEAAAAAAAASSQFSSSSSSMLGLSGGKMLLRGVPTSSSSSLHQQHHQSPNIAHPASRRVVKTYKDFDTQTDLIPLSTLNLLYDNYKKQLEQDSMLFIDDDGVGPAPTSPTSSTNPSGNGSTGGAESPRESDKDRRKTSIDNKDVSQSVSDTIKRYLNMARKTKKDDDANRFKRVNYDRNLRNIKAKGEITKPGDDDGLMKGCQTESNWLEMLLENSDELQRYLESEVLSPINSPTGTKNSSTSASSSFSCPSSPITLHPVPIVSASAVPSASGIGILQSGTQFLSNLFHTAAAATNIVDSNYSSSSPSTPSNNASIYSTSTLEQQQAMNSGIAMQKSKSSSNVGHLMSKKIFRSRSKSQLRTKVSSQVIIPSTSDVVSLWTPQGDNVWVTNSGKNIHLKSSPLTKVCDIERLMLEKLAQEKLQQLGISLTPAPPAESSSSVAKQTKRKVLLLKRKAVTTGIFESKSKDDCSSKGGLVFNLPLEQCIENNHTAAGGVVGGGGNDGGVSNQKTHDLKKSSSKSNLHASSPSPSSSRRKSSSDDEGGLLDPAALPGVQPHVQQVPSIVVACTKYLEEHGLHTVGIFRVSTSKKRVRQLREDFDKGAVTTIDSSICPHDIATLLKEFFRDLPEPLLTKHLYRAFLQTQSIRNRRLQLEAVVNVVRLLPVAHRDTLYVLLKFLAKVASASNDSKSFDQTQVSGNKMDSMNLATIIAPNILHCIKSDQLEEQEITERSDVINIIRIMIDHYEDIFTVSTEDINDIYISMMDLYPLQLDYLLDTLFTEQEKLNPKPPPLPTSTVLVDDKSQLQHSPSSRKLAPEKLTSAPKAQKRIIYSREDILHANAAKDETHSTRRVREVARWKI